MDMTAQERVYFKRAANHASGSGNISTNHSWNTGGKLEVLVPRNLGGKVTLTLLGAFS